MFEYRITKYDPGNRDATGRYLADEWIMYSQVGETIAGCLLTLDEYLRTERAYVNAAMDVLGDCGVESLVVRDLVNRRKHKPATFELREGVRLSGESLREALQSLLREEFWCRLEDDEGSYIHVGWDYYLYAGVPCAAADGVQAARANGLFVEPFVSPYKKIRPNAQLRR